MPDYEFSAEDVRQYERTSKAIQDRAYQIQGKVDELEMHARMMVQAHEELRRAIPVQALTVFLDWWEDPDYNDIPSYDDFMAVAALVDRMREV